MSDDGCEGFSLSPQQVRAFLNRAIIVTGMEIHDRYSWSPCYVKGTANLRGFHYIWTIRKYGTGSLDLFGIGEYVYEIADGSQAEDDDVE
jgi:hypothetical protein